MGAVFLSILNMSISASWIVLAVLILRLLLKKAPKWITVLLWGIVAVRLICPLSIESVLSLIPSAEPINPDILVEQAPVIDPDFPVIDGVENPGIIGGGNPVIGDNPVIGGDSVTGEPSAPTVDTPVNPLQIAITLSSYVWLVGIAGMLAYTVISYFRVKRRIGMAIRLQENIYQSENVVSPFVLGLIKPKIYLPFGMDGQDMDYVIAHENAHIRRKDHWWKPIGFLILTLHWFNPLLWLGYVLLCRDIELACDEKVIKELDFQQKADYSQALLNCSVNRRIIAACPLAFGEVGVKDRVKSVLNYKKPAFWIIVVAIVASIVTAVCFLTDPVKEEDGTEQFFSEGYLFFDIGAESMESIESCTIIHDGNPTELILSEEDALLFARYAYTDKVPVPELSEVFLYPKTKRIKVVVGDRSVMLYLMQDGSIVVNHTGESFRVYQAEEQDVITPEKYAQLVAKYATEPTTPNQSATYDKAVAAYYAFLNHQITAIAEDNSKFFVSSYGSISNGQSGIDRYALHDVNGDDIPELFIDAAHDHILSFDGENIRQWYSSMSWMGIQLLSSGAVVDTHSGAGSFINYLTFGPDGIEKFISFSGGPGGESGQYYYGEGKSEPSKEVSKDQWEALTKPYFQQMENKAELEWHTTIPTTPNNGAQVYPTITFQVNSSHPAYTAVVNYSNGSAVTAQSITITDRAAKKDIQTINVSGNELFAESVIYVADVTFDGNLDILIPYQQPASAAYFQAYVWQESEGQFVHAPRFEILPNFVIDKENQRILTTQTSSQITSYSISYYDAKAKDFRLSHAVYWEPHASNSDKMDFVEQRYENDKLVIVKTYEVEKVGVLDVNKSDPQIAEYFAAGSFWDLDSAKWKDQFYKPSQSGTTEGTESTEKTYTFKDVGLTVHSTADKTTFSQPISCTYNGKTITLTPHFTGIPVTAVYYSQNYWFDERGVRVSVSTDAGGRNFLVDKNGKIVTDAYAPISTEVPVVPSTIGAISVAGDGLYVYTDGALYGLKNSAGTVITKPLYRNDYISFYDGYAVAERADGTFVAIDTTGKEYSTLPGGRSNGNKTFLDQEGEPGNYTQYLYDLQGNRISGDYSSISYFYDGLALIRQGNKLGLISADGTVVLEPCIECDVVTYPPKDRGFSYAFMDQNAFVIPIGGEIAIVTISK